ncbi:MAG TPA: DUF6597 domain-containing transcriptional factor [Lacunisphaera sp.]|nr:DUF6597 domain-containing transcriptional factor [Lacunisphaera sp.]
MFTHLLHVPAGPVARFVEHLWLVRGRVPRPMRHLLLPDGAFVVIFNLGEPQRLCERADVRRHAVFRASWVSGQQPEPIVIEQSGTYDLVGIRFRPGGAFPLFRFGVAELTGRVVELEDIWGREATAVRQQLGEARGDRARLRCLERWLARRLVTGDVPDARIVHAAELLRRGGTGVGRIAEQVNLSPKHLVHEFTRKVGLAPKRFGRIQRLQRTVGLVGQRPEVSWSELAPLAGYFDQAHLINEFRDLVGLTPAEFLARRSPYPGYLNLA